jgi:hypothetical protein
LARRTPHAWSSDARNRTATEYRNISDSEKRTKPVPELPRNQGFRKLSPLLTIVIPGNRSLAVTKYPCFDQQQTPEQNMKVHQMK